VVHNPVEAGLSDNCEDWRWSSYAAAIGLAEPQSFVDPARVLQSFDSDRKVAAATLRAFVESPDEDVTVPGTGRVPLADAKLNTPRNVKSRQLSR